MKVKRKLQLLLATLFMSFGLVANLNKAPEIKTEAASVQPSSKIYFRPNANWRQASARFSIWFFDGTSNDQFVELLAEPSAGTNLYSCLSPSTGSYSGLIFVRHNPSHPQPISWDSKWNQTGNLTFDTNSNIYLAPEDNWGDGFTQAYWSGRFIPQNTTLYFRSTAAFMGTTNRVAVFVFNNVDSGTQSDNWANCTKIDTDVYQVSTPLCLNNKVPNYIIFCSMKSAANSWGNVENQTADLVFDGVKPLYDMATSAWQNYTPLPTVSPIALTEGITSSKLRIWLDRNGHYDTTGYTHTLKVGDNYYSPSGYYKSYHYLPDHVFFPYFDIDISIVNNAQVGIGIIDSSNKLHVEIPAQTFTAGDNSKLWYVTFTAGTWAYSKTTVTGKVFNTFFAKVLEGYITCLSSIHNGYGAYNLVNTNFVELDINNDWNMEGLLSDVNINDYMYQMDYSSGFRPLEVNAYDKYLALQAYYDAANPAPITLNFDSNAQITTLIIIALAGILTLAGYILLRKRYRLIK